MANLVEYLKELTPVKSGDAPEEAASSFRMNAIMALLRAVVRGDNIVSGLNVRKQSQDGWVILSAEPGGIAGSIFKFPFKVTGTARGNVLGVFIEPGIIAGLSPFCSDDLLGNVQLNHLPEKPILDLTTGAGVKPILIRCDMTSPGPDIFQGLVITAATMQSTYNPDIAPDPEPAGGGYKIFWDDTPTPPAPHLTGHFYVKIATVTVVNDAITEVEQLVSTNLPTFILAGEDVAIVMPLI